MSHKDAPTKHLIALLPCKSWKCPECRARMANEWRDRAEGHLANDIERGREAFVFVVEADGWDAARQMLCRSKANFIRIEQQRGQLLILGAVPAGRETGKRVCVDEAMGQLHGALDALVTTSFAAIADGGRVRPISACRAWERPPAKSNYAMTGVAKKRSLADLKDDLAEKGIPATIRSGSNGPVLLFRADDDAFRCYAVGDAGTVKRRRSLRGGSEISLGTRKNPA